MNEGQAEPNGFIDGAGYQTLLDNIMLGTRALTRSRLDVPEKDKLNRRKRNEDLLELLLAAVKNNYERCGQLIRKHLEGDPDKMKRYHRQLDSIIEDFNSEHAKLCYDLAYSEVKV